MPFWRLPSPALRTFLCRRAKTLSTHLEYSFFSFLLSFFFLSTFSFFSSCLKGLFLHPLCTHCHRTKNISLFLSLNSPKIIFLVLYHHHTAVLGPSCTQAGRSKRCAFRTTDYNDRRHGTISKKQWVGYRNFKKMVLQSIIKEQSNCLPSCILM